MDVSVLVSVAETISPLRSKVVSVEISSTLERFGSCNVAASSISNFLSLIFVPVALPIASRFVVVILPMGS